VCGRLPSTAADVKRLQQCWGCQSIGNLLVSAVLALMVSVPVALGSTASASTAVDLFTDANPRIEGQHVHTMPVPFVSDRP
jgi:hypothetical protein